MAEVASVRATNGTSKRSVKSLDVGPDWGVWNQKTGEAIIIDNGRVVSVEHPIIGDPQRLLSNDPAQNTNYGPPNSPADPLAPVPGIEPLDQWLQPAVNEGEPFTAPKLDFGYQDPGPHRMVLNDDAPFLAPTLNFDPPKPEPTRANNKDSQDISESQKVRCSGVPFIATTRASATQREHLLDRYYWPHHRKLESLVCGCLDAHDYCLIIDAHSFPSVRLPYELDASPERPDICIGTDPDVDWRIE